MEDAQKQIEDIYLGDGVYASFDGYHIWLDTREQFPVSRIALDPDVAANLAGFQKYIREVITKAKTAQASPLDDRPERQQYP